MSELIHGPVPMWESSPEDLSLTERLLTSESELDRAYGEAYRNGCFVTEFGGPDEEHGIAAVGEMQALAILEFRLGREIYPHELSIGDCINMGANPGSGKSRAECVRSGLQMVLDKRKS